MYVQYKAPIAVHFHEGRVQLSAYFDDWHKVSVSLQPRMVVLDFKIPGLKNRVVYMYHTIYLDSLKGGFRKKT